MTWKLKKSYGITREVIPERICNLSIFERKLKGVILKKKKKQEKRRGTGGEKEEEVEEEVRRRRRR